MDEKKSRIIGLILTALVLILAFAVEWFIQPGYLIKSIIKVATFGGVIALFASLSKKNIKEIIDFNKPERIGKLVICIAVFFVGIGILAFAFHNMISWSGIRESLVTKEGLTRKNCFFVFSYIIIVNSFLEEAFFRGFIPKMFSKKPVGFVISAVLFSVYHIGIIGSWFNVLIFMICVIGLTLVGLFLQWVEHHFKTIIANWMVHASANIAINVIGTLLIFEILK